MAKAGNRYPGLTFFILNILFILMIVLISFGLAEILLSTMGLDEIAILLASIPLAMFISSLIFVLIGRVIRRHRSESPGEAINGVVSEIAEMKGKNGLTYFKFKVNGRQYELPLLPETYFLLNLQAGEKVMIPITQEVRRYLA